MVDRLSISAGLAKPQPVTLESIRKQLHASAEPSRVSILQRFFKTGPGEYAEGDRFIGVTVPSLRKVCRECRGAPLNHALALLRSPIHRRKQEITRSRD